MFWVDIIIRIYYNKDSKKTRKKDARIVNQDFYLPKLPLPPYGKTSIKCGNDSQTEAFFKHRVKILQQSIAENNDPIDYDTRNPFTKRRLKAIKHTMPEVVKRYSDRIPYTEGLGDLLEQTWVAMNAPQMSFNDIERCNNIVFAAAIWILDHVEIPKILPYLPTDDAFIEDYDGPLGVWDCKYDLDLIASVVHVIENRNGKPDRNDDGEAIHLINDELTALGKKTYEGTTRKQFEAIISLIPQKDLLFATERWKSLFWQWTDTFFQNFEVNVVEMDGIVRDAFEMGVRSNAIVDAHNKLYKSIVTARTKSIKKQQKTIFDKPLQSAPITTPKLPFPAPGTHQFPAVSKTENILLNAFTTELGPDGSKLTDYYKQWIEINKQIRTRAEKVKDFLEDVEDYRMNAVDYDSTIKFELHDEDLYGLCFATLYLADTDDDLAWLYGPGCAMMAQIADSLPWSMGFFMEEEEESIPEEDLEPMEVKPVEMLDWYERKYASKEDPDARSLAQVMYENCGCIMPRDMHQFDYLAPEFKRYGIRGKTLEILLSCMSAVSTARSQNRAVNLFRWDDDSFEETAEEPSVTVDDTGHVTSASNAGSLIVRARESSKSAYGSSYVGLMTYTEYNTLNSGIDFLFPHIFGDASNNDAAFTIAAGSSSKTVTVYYSTGNIDTSNFSHYQYPGKLIQSSALSLCSVIGVVSYLVNTSTYAVEPVLVDWSATSSNSSGTASTGSSQTVTVTLADPVPTGYTLMFKILFSTQYFGH